MVEGILFLNNLRKIFLFEIRNYCFWLLLLISYCSWSGIGILYYFDFILWFNEFWSIWSISISDWRSHNSSLLPESSIWVKIIKFSKINYLSRRIYFVIVTICSSHFQFYYIFELSILKFSCFNIIYILFNGKNIINALNIIIKYWILKYLLYIGSFIIIIL